MVALIVASMLVMPGRGHAQAFELGGGRPSSAELLADQWYLMAKDALAGQSEPRADQYQRARLLLDQALDLAPEDANLWRMRAELAERTNNTKARIKALSRYTDLAAADDRAQYELIMARIQELQTVDARLSRLERILQSKLAEQLSEPLRSRLAVEAAAAAREMSGPEDSRFLRHLKQALDLDPSNDRAALMMYQLLRGRYRSDQRPQASAQSVAAAAIHLTKAAPLDGTVRATLADHLADQGVFGEAATQFGHAQQLTGGRLSAAWHKGWITSLAADGQTQAALAQLRQYARRLEAGQAQTKPTKPELDPDSDQRPGTADAPGDAPPAEAGPTETDSGNADTATSGEANAEGEPAAGGDEEAASSAGLPIHMRMVKLAILYQPAQTERWQKTFDGIWQKLSTSADAGETPAQAQLAWLGAVFNRKTEQARGYIEDLPADNPQARLAKGWLAFHAGQPEQAREHWSAIAERDPMARFGLALLNGADVPGKARRLKQVIQSAPRSLGGLMAARWLVAHDDTPEPTAVGRSLVRLMESMPAAVWQMSDLAGWIDVQWQRGPVQFSYLRPMERTLVVRNRTSLPLSIGQQGTLRSQAMVQIAPFRGGRSLGTLPAKIVDIGRRLTVGANDSVSVDIRLDRSEFGPLLLASPFNSYVFNLTATVNPRSTRRGIKPGPVGGSDTARSLVTRTLPPSQANAKQWLNTLSGESAGQPLIALARLVQLQPAGQGQGGAGDQPGNGDAGDGPAGDGDNGDPAGGQAGGNQAGGENAQRQPVDQAMVDRIERRVTRYYNEGTARDRAWIVRVLGGTDQPDTRFNDIRQQARRSGQPLVRIAYLANHVTDPEAPTLAQAEREYDGPIETFAAALRKGLEAEAKQASEGQSSGEASDTAGQAGGDSQPGQSGGSGPEGDPAAPDPGQGPDGEAGDFELDL